MKYMGSKITYNSLVCVYNSLAKIINNYNEAVPSYLYENLERLDSECQSESFKIFARERNIKIKTNN